MPVAETDISPSTEISFSSVSPGQGNTIIELDIPFAAVNEAAFSQYRSAKDVITFAGVVS